MPISIKGLLLVLLIVSSGLAPAKPTISEQEIQKVLATPKLTDTDKNSLTALKIAVKGFATKGDTINGVITTKTQNEKLVVNVNGCGGAIWGSSIQIMQLQNQRARIGNEQIEKRNTLIDKEDSLRNDLIRSMKSQTLYNEAGSATSTIDTECAQSSEIVNTVFDDIYIKFEAEYAKIKQQNIEQQQKEVSREATSRPQETVSNQPPSEAKKESESEKAAQVVSSAPTPVQIAKPQSTQPSGTTSTNYSKLVEEAAVWAFILLLVGILISLPIALILRWQEKVVLIENLTDAFIIFMTSVATVIAVMIFGSDSSKSTQFSVLFLLLLTYAWNLKVASRSNNGIFYTLLVSLARLGVSCFLLVFLVSGKNGIQGQRGNESDLAYLVRYSKDLQAENDRGTNQTLFGLIFTLFVALAINQYKFENIPSYFSRKFTFN